MIRGKIHHGAGTKPVMETVSGSVREARLLMEITGFPVIRDDSGTLFYGGSQDWYRQKFHRLAGCGPTCAANLAAFYEIGIRPEKPYRKDHFLGLMDRMYEYVKPGMRGFPWRDRFQEKFLQYAKDQGVSLSTGFLEQWTDAEPPFRYVKNEIDAGRPLAMLILEHTEESIEDETWHWMAVTGYEETECGTKNPAVPADPTDEKSTVREDQGSRKLIVSTYGKKKLLDAELVFRPHKKNDVHLVSFARDL